MLCLLYLYPTKSHVEAQIRNRKETDRLAKQQNVVLAHLFCCLVVGLQNNTRSPLCTCDTRLAMFFFGKCGESVGKLIRDIKALFIISFLLWLLGRYPDLHLYTFSLTTNLLQSFKDTEVTFHSDTVCVIQKDHRRRTNSLPPVELVF